jgi:hypothetical protein
MRTLLRRRPSPALIVSGLALVLAGATSAVAATIITTSRQIKDGVILSRDVHHNTLANGVIRNGTLLAEDLAPSTRSALRGPRGARGVQGPVGPRGRRGATGGTVLSILDYNTARVPIGPGATENADVACSAGLQPVGGGYRDTSGKLFVRSSFPARGSLRGWSVRVTNTATVRVSVAVYVVCAPARRTS